MSADMTFSKQELDKYLNELGKEFRRLNGKNAHAEIILIGGASIVINYDFRSMTNDADALIYTDAVMKDSINRVRDKHRLSHGWLNEDFKRTKSFTEKLRGVSIPYRTFSNTLHIRTIAAEYLIAMKAMSGRQYKFDLSDIVGILWEHEKRGASINKETVSKAVFELYGTQSLPDISEQFLNAVFSNDTGYAEIYNEARKKEIEAKEILLEVQKRNPDMMNRDNLDDIISLAVRKREQSKASIPDEDDVFS